MKLATALFLAGVLCSPVASLKILVFMPVPSQSHYLTFKPLIEELAQRKHEVTFIGPFPPKVPIRNLEYIVVNTQPIGTTVQNQTRDDYSAIFSFSDTENMFGNHASAGFTAKVGVVWGFWNYTKITCNTMLHSQTMYDFAAQDRHYDLIIGEAFHTNCWFGFVQKYKAPLVLFTTSAPMMWYYDNMALPNNPAYIPNLYAGFSSKMSLLEKVQNLLINVIHVYYFNYIQEPTNFELARKFFGDDLQDFDEILKNATLLLTNSHFTIMGAKPKVVGLIEVGGIHIERSKKLPKVSKEKPKHVWWFKVKLN